MAVLGKKDLASWQSQDAPLADSLDQERVFIWDETMRTLSLLSAAERAG
jgi:hypothetical protein